MVSNKIPELESLGLKEGSGRHRLTVNQTKDLLSLIRAHVSFSVSIYILHRSSYLPILEDGGRLSYIGQRDPITRGIEYKWCGSIVPEFQMEPTRFEYAATSYGGVVDYLIVKGPPTTISEDEL